MKQGNSFPCPTSAEVAAASAAITADGPGAEATMLLSLLCSVDPLLRAARERKVELLKALSAPTPDFSFTGGDLVRQMAAEAGLDSNDVLITGTVSSLTVYGLNLGIRIGEARRQGLRSRRSVENLLAHVRDGHCTGLPGVGAMSEESRASAILLLERVLGVERTA